MKIPLDHHETTNFLWVVLGFAYGIPILDEIQNYPFLFHQGLRLSRSGRLFWRDIFFGAGI